MGWGASAGFVEQQSHVVQQPLDAIIRNDAGAFATRELLGQELSRGRESSRGALMPVELCAVNRLDFGFIHRCRR